MGSFSSAPKILNEDHQDNDISLPKAISRNELLQHCQKQSMLHHPMIKRAFRKSPDSSDLNQSLKFRKLNSVSKGD